MTRANHGLLAVLAVLLLGACSQSAIEAPLTERVHEGALSIAVTGEGELQSTRATPLVVPGRPWTQRQLIWSLPDGAMVQKGDVVARFSAKQSKQDLKQAMIDLQRNALAQVGTQTSLQTKEATLDVNLADVATQLAIARRYADAGFEALSRNRVLDAVQNEQFLTTKQGVLDWRSDQAAERGAAELAVLDAEAATLKLQADQKRSDLESLELRAPHDGILVLESDWSGEKPQIGSTLWAGRNFARLPDTSAMEIEIQVPQLQAQGIEVGDKVVIHPLGVPAESTSSEISWVARAAQPRSRQSPVKYLAVKAPVAAAVVKQFAWLPGQRFQAEVVLFASDKAISVPNIAIESHGTTSSVRVLEDGMVVEREVELGVRGAARSLVQKGLQPGDEVLLGDAAPEAQP